MIRHVEPALRANGELDWVESAVRKLRTSGTGADQQRASFARRGLLADVVLELNKINPGIAARMTGGFNQWRRFDEKRRALMRGRC